MTEFNFMPLYRHLCKKPKMAGYFMIFFVGLSQSQTYISHKFRHWQPT